MLKIDFHPPEQSLRQFGWIALFGFPLMATAILWLHQSWQPNSLVYLFYALGPVSLLLSLIHPKAVKPIYVAMMLVALPIGIVVSQVLLRFIYYVLFTPLALWFR